RSALPCPQTCRPRVAVTDGQGGSDPAPRIRAAIRTDNRSDRGQHRERVTFRTLQEIGLRAFPMIECNNACRHWSAAAGVNHGFDRRTRTSEHCLDRTIASIAYPTVYCPSMCFLLDKGAIADTLNPAAHDHVANDCAGHARSPASTARVPAQRDADQRSIERI